MRRLAPHLVRFFAYALCKRKGVLKFSKGLSVRKELGISLSPKACIEGRVQNFSKPQSLRDTRNFSKSLGYFPTCGVIKRWGSNPGFKEWCRDKRNETCQNSNLGCGDLWKFLFLVRPELWYLKKFWALPLHIYRLLDQENSKLNPLYGIGSKTWKNSL